MALANQARWSGPAQKRFAGSERRYAPAAQRPVVGPTRHMRILVLPEKIEVLDEQAAARARATLSAWARDHRTHLLAGFALTEPDHRSNRAWLFDNCGGLKADYAKRHLVPLVERQFRPGERDAVVAIQGRSMGIAICKDMDFPRLAARYRRAGAEAVLVPAWDFDVDAVFHARMAVLRGIEQGFTVIRAARRGLLTISDPFGRIAAETPSAGAPVVTLFAQAPVAGLSTWYSRMGDTFGWVCAAASALLALARVVKD